LKGIDGILSLTFPQYRKLNGGNGKGDKDHCKVIKI